MISHSKETFKQFEEKASDLLVPEEDIDEYTKGDIEACNDIHVAYMEILKIAKRLYKKKIYSISFLLMFILTTIHHGPESVDDILGFMMKYYNDRITEDDSEYINCYDDNGNRLKIEDLDKL